MGKYRQQIQVGVKYTTLTHFQPVKKEDLPLKKYDIIEIVKLTSDANWVIGKNMSGNIGVVLIDYLVALNYVLTNYAWFHAHLDRGRCDALLMQRTEGHFLVRRSEMYPDDFCLSVRGAEKPHHYRIIADQSHHRFSLEEEQEFPDIPLLIRHYQAHPKGLCSALRHAVTAEIFLWLRLFRHTNWVIERDRLALHGVIGSGEFAEVSKATYEGREVAVKSNKTQLGKLSHSQSLLLSEASVLMEVRHENVLQLVGVFHEQHRLFLITEFMASGALTHFLRTRLDTQLGAALLLRILADICRGMTHVARLGIVHRDLAARNILLSRQLTAKVADFGLAKRISAAASTNDDDDVTCTAPTDDATTTTKASQPVSSKQSEPIRGDATSNATANPTSDSARNQHHPAITNRPPITKCAIEQRYPIKWTAPEVLKNHKNISHKSDVWSLGIIMWETFSHGRTPYAKIPIENIGEALHRGYRMSPPNATPKEVSSIMQRCWKAKPHDRPSFDELLSELLAQRMTQLALDPENNTADAAGDVAGDAA